MEQCLLLEAWGMLTAKPMLIPQTHGKNFHIIKLLYFSMMQFCYYYLLYLIWTNVIN